MLAGQMVFLVRIILTFFLSSLSFPGLLLSMKRTTLVLLFVYWLYVKNFPNKSLQGKYSGTNEEKVICTFNNLKKR